MNDWYFFVLQAVVGNLHASCNLESISLSRGGGDKQERHESGRRIDWKKLPVYFVSAVKKKCQCRQARTYPIGNSWEQFSALVTIPDNGIRQDGRKLFSSTLAPAPLLENCTSSDLENLWTPGLTTSLPVACLRPIHFLWHKVGRSQWRREAIWKWRGRKNLDVPLHFSVVPLHCERALQKIRWARPRDQCLPSSLTMRRATYRYTRCLKKVGHFYIHDNFGNSGPVFIFFYS